MTEPTYREALRASWRLAWHHKNLWPLGLFAMLWGQFGLLELVLKIHGVTYIRDNPTLWQWCQAIFSQNSWQQMKVLLGGRIDNWIWAVWLGVMVLGLMIALAFVATVTQGALVYAGAKFAKFRLTYPDEAKAWHVGVKNFWSVLTLNIIRKVTVALAGLWAVSAAFMLANNQSGYSSLWLTILLVLGFLAALLVGVMGSFLLIYAVGYVVVEGYGAGEAIVMAWHLFKRHKLVSWEVGLVVLLLNVVLLLFALFAVLYAFFLPVIIGSYLVVFLHAPIIGKVIGSLSYAVFLAILMAASAVFTVYVTTLWAYLFSKMHSGGVAAKLVRLLRR